MHVMGMVLAFYNKIYVMNYVIYSSISVLIATPSKFLFINKHIIFNYFSNI